MLEPIGGTWRYRSCQKGTRLMAMKRGSAAWFLWLAVIASSGWKRQMKAGVFRQGGCSWLKGCQGGQPVSCIFLRRSSVVYQLSLWDCWSKDEFADLMMPWLPCSWPRNQLFVWLCVACCFSHCSCCWPDVFQRVGNSGLQFAFCIASKSKHREQALNTTNPKQC